MDSTVTAGDMIVRLVDQSRRADRFWYALIAIVSAAAIGLVLFLVYGPRLAGGGRDVGGLATLNAGLNATAALLLVAAYLAVRGGKLRLHRALTLSTFATSALFLVSYLTYHTLKAGPRPYTGQLTWLYLPLLLSHIVLAATIVPLSLITLYRGWVGFQNRADRQLATRHRRIARVTLPIWLYVSVTGVLVYLMLLPADA